MPHTIEFDAAHKRITVVVSPPVSLQGALECFRSIRMDAQFGNDYAILVNSLGPERPPTQEEGLALATVLGNFFPGQKIAWVRHNPPKNPGIEIMRTMANVKLELRNFSQVEDAEAWLSGYTRRTETKMPPQERCRGCGHSYAGTVCPICKTPRIGV